MRTKGEVDKKLQRTYQHETHYARLTAQGKLSSEAYAHLQAELTAQRRWCVEEHQRVERNLVALKMHAEASAQLDELTHEVEGRQETATFEEKRIVLETLAAQVRVGRDGSLELELHIPVSRTFASPYPACCRSVRAPARTEADGLTVI